MTTKERARRIIRKVGGAATIRDGLRRYRRQAGLMVALRKELTDRYPNKWVAMSDDDVVCVGDTLKDVLAELDRKGISRGDAVVEYLDTEPRSMIL